MKNLFLTLTFLLTMALNAEVIKSNEGLNDLTDDQISKIVTLSVNDENTVIAGKTKDIYDGLDNDIKEVSGLEKEANEKTYSFAKRAITSFKSQLGEVETYKTQINDLNTKISTYEEQIKNGDGDAALKQQLVDAQSRAKALEESYNTLQTDFKAKETEYTTSLKMSKVSSILASEKSGLKFKSDYPETVQKTLLSSAESSILSNNPDIVEVDGNDVLVFRDEKGEILRNPENGLNPYTAKELLSKQLKDVLDLGKKQHGLGSEPPVPGNPTVDLVDLGSAKSQVEADKLIEKHLLQKGLTKNGFSEGQLFQEEFQKIRKENNIDKLPLRG